MKKLKNYILNKSGRFGIYGGRYVPEMLVPIMDELAKAFYKLKTDKQFKKELANLYKTYSGRPTPLYFCENLTNKLNGAKIFLKNGV